MSLSLYQSCCDESTYAIIIILHTRFPNLHNWTQECNVFNDPTIVYTVLVISSRTCNMF